jgi:DNA-binding transcriptional ArsR family regulator
MQSDEHSETLADIRSQYVSFQYLFVNFIADHLVDCSKEFAGDLQKMLVLAIIGQVALQARRRSAAEGTAMANYPSISASRIAGSSGIPRETVRRKLMALAADGLVEQTEDSGWRLSSSPAGVSAAAVMLADLDARAVDRFARLLRSVRELGL